MNNNLQILLTLLFVSAAMVLVACNQQVEPAAVAVNPTTAPPTSTPLPPSSTPTEIPPTETPIPPSETPIPPTETVTLTVELPTITPTPEPTEPLPEHQVTTADELFGKWQADNLVKDYTVYDEDGTVLYLDRNGITRASARFRFENGIYIMDHNRCEIADPNTGTIDITPCAAKYKVFLSMDGGIPVCLRFEVLDDPWVTRRLTIIGQLWCWYQGK